MTPQFFTVRISAKTSKRSNASLYVHEIFVVGALCESEALDAAQPEIETVKQVWGKFGEPEVLVEEKKGGDLVRGGRLLMIDRS